jgi:hypothetical protein
VRQTRLILTTLMLISLSLPLVSTVYCQDGRQEYTVTYPSSGASIKYTFEYPTVVQAGASFSLTIIAQHVSTSTPATGLQLQFTPSPPSSIWILTPSSVLAVGNLNSGIQARNDFSFSVSPNAPAGQQLQISTTTTDSTGVWQSMSPDILISVASASTTTTTTTTTTWWTDQALIATLGLVIILVVVGIAAVLLLTRRKPSPPAVGYKPMMPPAQPFMLKPGAPQPSPSQAIKPGAHVPRVVARREEEKK